MADGMKERSFWILSFNNVSQGRMEIFRQRALDSPWLPAFVFGLYLVRFYLCFLRCFWVVVCKAHDQVVFFFGPLKKRGVSRGVVIEKEEWVRSLE